MAIEYMIKAIKISVNKARYDLDRIEKRLDEAIEMIQDGHK